ncbi:hypothetical protein H2198_008398 [Neophaeococcomyces mojaviensis]|uniref:Uncharacterized protein n=1 Tax=Neophaeococcomyces mojaviensis TaxID=3383035 RepID=A0ACC2ZXD8_9EURO|nr:hypothetical protein H2198_008398 [Knufia sp. JES_112]
MVLLTNRNRPQTCKVSAPCATTAAAKDFCGEYKIGETAYWDDSFPNTHNVSKIALDEAATIFGKELKPDFVLSISPGIPTQKEIDTLHRVASRNASTNLKIRYHFDSLRRALSGVGVLNPVPKLPVVSAHSQSSPELHGNEFNLGRTGTTSSISSIETERKHQESIKSSLSE